VQFRRLHQAFGAEVLDVDLRTDLAPRWLDEIRAAFDDYQLLLIRHDGQVSPGRQVEVTSWFGSGRDLPDAQSSATIDNDNATGSIRLRFHSDHTYSASPTQIISLHALEVPRTGAPTSFISGVHGWDSLPSERQELLAGMTARHRHKLVALGEDGPEFRADHPVCLRHPQTAKSVLFISESHTDLIYGVDPVDSDRLLTELKAHLTAPERTYVHGWQLYDFLIWDNLALQHARPEEAIRANGRRLLQRSTRRLSWNWTGSEHSSRRGSFREPRDGK
jgi:taurine dioxygenase